MLLNSGKSPVRKFSIFKIQYSVFDILTCPEGRKHTARSKVSTANASEYRPGIGETLSIPRVTCLNNFNQHTET